MHIYPKLDIKEQDESEAIKRVNIIASIKLRLKSKIDMHRIKVEQDSVP